MESKFTAIKHATAADTIDVMKSRHFHLTHLTLLQHPSIAIINQKKNKTNPNDSSTNHGLTIRIKSKPSIKQALLHWVNHGNFLLEVSYRQMNVALHNELTRYLPLPFHHLLSLLKNDVLRINLTRQTLYITYDDKTFSAEKKIYRKNLFHSPYSNRIRCYGGWITPLGGLSVIDHLIKAVSSIRLQRLLMNPHLRKKLQYAFAHRSEELSYYTKTRRLPSHNKKITHLTQLIQKQHKPEALFTRHIRTQSESKISNPELSAYIVKINHFYGKEAGAFSRNICLNKHCKLEYKFKRRPRNIQAVLHELFYDTEIFYNQSHLSFQLDQPNLMSSALSYYLSFCSKWGNDMCQTMAPLPHQFISQLKNVETNNTQVCKWTTFISILVSLILFSKLLFYIKKKRPPMRKKISPHLYTRAKASPLTSQKKVQNKPPIKKKEEVISRHSVTPTLSESVKTKTKLRPLRLNKREKATLKIQAIIEKRNKDRKKRTQRNQTPEKIFKLPKYISHSDNYTDKAIENIPSNGQAVLAQLLQLSNALCNKLYLKGSNAIHPERNPIDIDLQMFCTNDVCKMYHRIESQFPTEQINIQHFGSDLISFQLNIRAAPPFDITLSSSSEESFLFQDLSLSTCSGLRHIRAQGKKIKYGLLILPVSNLSPTTHRKSQKKIISLIKKKELKPLHNTYQKTQELIQYGNILLVTQNFSHIFKQTLKLNCLSKTHIQIINILIQLAQRILAHQDIREKQSNFIRMKIKNYINNIPSFLLQIQQSEIKKTNHLHYFTSLAKKIHNKQFKLVDKTTLTTQAPHQP